MSAGAQQTKETGFAIGNSLSGVELHVRAALAGEETAWNTLYKYYYPGLYATALRVFNDIDTAKDAVHDAFIKAYLKLAQLKDPAAFGDWLKKILIHTCYRSVYYNKKNRLNNLPAESDTRFEDEVNDKLDKLYIQSHIYTTLAYLSEDLRTTLLLRYFSGFQSYGEIADILSIPAGTVRSRLNQAKLKLAKHWQQQIDTDPTIFKRSQEWNHFYYTHFSGMHHHDNYKNKLITHLQKDVHLIFPGGQLIIGRLPFENKIIDDRDHGSWLTPDNVISCGSISVVEAKHFNSPENPTHCPPRSALVLYRHEEKVSKINFHVSLQ